MHERSIVRAAAESVYRELVAAEFHGNDITRALDLIRVTACRSEGYIHCMAVQ